MAPVFVPMLMLLGYSPEVTQAAYRVGDSTTNIISPMMRDEERFRASFVVFVCFVFRT